MWRRCCCWSLVLTGIFFFISAKAYFKITIIQTINFQKLWCRNLTVKSCVYSGKCNQCIGIFQWCVQEDWLQVNLNWRLKACLAQWYCQLLPVTEQSILNLEFEDTGLFKYLLTEVKFLMWSTEICLETFLYFFSVCKS